MNKIKNEDFESIVYISHPYGGLKENQNKIEKIISELLIKYPNYLFISPVHTFGFAYNLVPYKVGIKYCLWLLEHSDEMWVYDDWENSKGCIMEVEYCKEYEIPYEMK